jgi:hypothetical protein
MLSFSKRRLPGSRRALSLMVTTGVALVAVVARPAQPPASEAAAHSQHAVRLGSYRGDPALDPTVIAADDSARRLRLVQLTGTVHDDWRSHLERTGLHVLAYVPENAYLVWATTATIDLIRRLEETPFVRWNGAVPPPAKRGHSFSKESGPVDLLALYVVASGAPDVQALVGSLGGVVENAHPAQPDRRLWLAVVRIPAEHVADLVAEDGIVWVEPVPGAPILDGEMSSVVVSGDLEDGQPRPGYRSWLDGVEFDGTGVLWAVVDSGVDPLHPDLVGLAGISYPGCETDLPGDDPGFSGHGTPVASIVAGTSAAGMTDPEGFLWGLGVAPGADLLSQNAICDAGVSWPPIGGWQILSRDGIRAGAVGSNNSWNSQEGIAHGYQISERVHDLMARDGDFDTPEVAEPYILVFNIGNQGPEPSTVPAPKEAKNLITVGAIANWRVAGDLDTVAGFSSRGPTLDGRIVPTVVAPGIGIGAAEHRLGGFAGMVFEIAGTDGLYMAFEGTSAAAPHVSGMLAVTTQWWRTTHRSAAPSPAAARALVVNGAVPLEEGPSVPNFDVGWGRANLGRIIASDEPLWIVDQAVRLTATGASWQQEVVVDDPTRPLRITVAWTDEAAAAGADPALVNDLDLSVATAGVSYLGNHFVDGWSVPGGSPDRLNNLEDVHVAEPGSSALVTVTAFHLPGDGVPYNGDLTDQDFAIVCRNCRTPLPERRLPGRRLIP